MTKTAWICISKDKVTKIEHKVKIKASSLLVLKFTSSFKDMKCSNFNKCELCFL